LINARNPTHPATIALLTLPYGIALGWTSGPLPLTLARQMFTLSTVLVSVSLTALLYVLHILSAPVVDLSLSLRRWYNIGLALAIGGIMPFFWLTLKPGTPEGVIKVLVGGSQLGALLMLLSAIGFMVRYVSPGRIGQAAGWYQAGVLGGQGLARVGTYLLTCDVSWQIIFLAEIPLLLIGIVVLYRLPAGRPEKKMPIGTAPAQTVSDGRSWFRSSKGIFILLMALSPIGVGAATVGWPNGMRQYAIPENWIGLVIDPFTIVCSLAGFLVGGWASDRYGRWTTWLYAGTLLALVGLLLAICPSIPTLFYAGILCYAFVSGACTAAFWAIIVQAVNPRLAITKITLLWMVMGIAIFYMRVFDGHVCDDYSFQFMLIGEALLSFICIGIALLLKRRLGIRDPAIPR